MDLLPVGIDPGLKGGCALVHDDRVLFYRRAKVDKQWQVKVQSRRRGKSRPVDDTGKYVSIYDPDWTIDALRQCDRMAMMEGFSGVAVFLEEPQSMQNRDSHASYISMGRCMEVWESAAHKLGLPLYIVNPKHWKTRAGLSADKQQSLERAAKLFPLLPSEVRQDDNICEAAILAAWARDHLPDCLLLNPEEYEHDE